MKYNLKKLKEICRTKDSIQMLQALVEAEAELREILEDYGDYDQFEWAEAKKVIKEILGE